MVTIKTTGTESGWPYNLLEDIYYNTEHQYLREEVTPDQIKGLWHILQTLVPREQEMILQKYRDEMTLEEIAQEHKLTRERIRQIIVKGLRKLRHPVRMKYIKDGYLIASGELEKRVQDRYSREMAVLEERYKNRLAELTKKIQHPEPKNEATLATPIEMLDLSVRSRNALTRQRVKTVGDLVILSHEELCRFRCLGAKSVQEIEDRIKSLQIVETNHQGE
jgi:predicted DNA-binding protein YlxM (UPF0122 family)